MTRPTEMTFARAMILGALIPLAACGPFKLKPAASPAPAPAPTQGGARPTTPAGGQPAARPTGAQPTNQPATPPTTAPAGARPAPAGGAPAGAAPAGAAPAGANPAGATPAGATPTGAARGATPAGATPAGAAPAGAAPAANSLAAAATAMAATIKRDSARIADASVTRRRSPVYLMLMFDMQNGRFRSADNGALAPEEEPTLGSMELTLQRARGGGIGLTARSIAGDDASPKYLEVGLLMGSRRFALDLGAATRTGFDSLGFGGGGAFDSTYIFPRVGFRSRANIGNTDFSVQLRALYYIGIPLGDDALPKDELEGWSGETGLSWTWNRFPLTANLGYRIERFKVFAVEQETSSFSLGLGLLLGRK